MMTLAGVSYNATAAADLVPGAGCSDGERSGGRLVLRRQSLRCKDCIGKGTRHGRGF